MCNYVMLQFIVKVFVPWEFELFYFIIILSFPLFENYASIVV